ncbi:MAG: hypothetical protein AABY22_06010 [Nanoarchaeota archaeon]
MKIKLQAIICYGCDKEKYFYRMMKVEYERKPQKFCKECFERLVKIKLGIQ